MQSQTQKKTIAKKRIKLTGVTFDRHQEKIFNLKKNINGAWLSLERRPTDDDPYHIYVVAHVKDQRPFRIGAIPKNVAFWLAPRLDEAAKAAKRNHTKLGNEYLAHITSFEITGGYSCYFGVNATLIYEVPKTS